MDDRERELTEATAELSETLKALRSELQEPPRGPLGLPRPPSPGELLRFTEQYTIPTVIALLEASIRTLELLAAALRVADGRPLDAATGADRSSRTGSLETVGEVGRDRLAAASRETLRRLDEALAELQSAAAAGDPSNPELRRLLEEARDLRTEVDERLSDAVAESEDGNGIEGDGPAGTGIGSAEDGVDDVGIDVDAELASIKDELDDEGPVDATDTEEKREDRSDDRNE